MLWRLVRVLASEGVVFVGPICSAQLLSYLSSEPFLHCLLLLCPKLPHSLQGTVPPPNQFAQVVVIQGLFFLMSAVL